MIKPYYENEYGILYKGDCLEIMPNLNIKVDLVLTSPPYNIGAMHSNQTKHGSYANNDMDESKYQEWQIDFINTCLGTMHEDALMFYNHKIRIKQGVGIHPFSWILKTSAVFKQEITWDLGKSANCDKIRFFPFSERIYVLAKNPKTKLYNVDNLSDVWRVCQNTKRKESGHIAVMPEQIAINCIRATDSKVVLEPFGGSGTTAIACMNTNRKFIMIEKEEKYCEVSAKRMEEHLIKLKSEFDDI